VSIEDAVKVLERAGFGCAIMDDGSVFITRQMATDNPLFTQGGSAYEPEEAKEMALTLLSEDNQVMERVHKHLFNWGGDTAFRVCKTDIELVKFALDSDGKSGITAQELLGVEG
jgi:hypothetical protein